MGIIRKHSHTSIFGGVQKNAPMQEKSIISYFHNRCGEKRLLVKDVVDEPVSERMYVHVVIKIIATQTHHCKV